MYSCGPTPGRPLVGVYSTSPLKALLEAVAARPKLGGVNGTKVLGNEVGTGRRVGRKQSPDRPWGRVCADPSRQHALEDQSRSFVVERHSRAEHAAGNTVQKRQGRCLPGLIQLHTVIEAIANQRSEGAAAIDRNIVGTANVRVNRFVRQRLDGPHRSS